LADAENLFTSMMNDAFTGQLTAEWEAENAKWIAAQVELQEQLPLLLLLALIREKATRVARSSTRGAVPITALMKYVFLFQMEGSSRRRFYHFVPYHYGPFARELYTDLERLQAEGLINVDSETDEVKTRIALADPAKADAALAELPDDLKEDVATIIDAYGDLDHNALLKTIYDKYPTYTTKSRVKRRANLKKDLS
jgi:type I restriction enzyme S subunit